MEIAGYSALEPLGRGGFSSVYRAHQAAQSRDVAIKVLTVDVSDDAARSRFERECAANGRLGSHPNVMTVFESGYTPDGKPYISMELCPGGSLADQLAGGVFSVDDVLRIGIKIAGAVETAHRNGITHRDIKPENILTTSFGEVVLADFGISALDSVRSGTATAGSFTLSHVPPEVLQGEVSGVPGDIYALGSTLYRLLTGRPPFADETTPLAVAITRTLNDPLPDPGPGVPPELTRVLEAAMAKEPTRRPGSALRFAEMLQQVQDETGRAKTEPVVAVIAPAAGSLTDAPETPSEPVQEVPVPRPNDTVRPVPVDDTVRPEPVRDTVRPAVDAVTGAGHASPRPVPETEATAAPQRKKSMRVLAIVGAVVLLLVAGSVVVAGGGSGGGDAVVGDSTVASTVPFDTSVAPAATASPTTSAASSTASGSASGAGSKKPSPTTVASQPKSTTTAAPAVVVTTPTATDVPATAAPAAVTTTTVRISIGITVPKVIILGCYTRAACAQALVDAWEKNDVTAAKAAAVSTNNYQAVTTMFLYPFKTYGTGFASTVVKVNETVYTLSSTRSSTPTKFSFVFDGTDASSVKVLAVLAQSK
jgi:serine/threonine protein kinase